MHKLFTSHKKTSVHTPLLINSSNFQNDTNEDDVAANKTKLTLKNHTTHHDHQQANPLSIPIIKILIENHQTNDENEDCFLKFFENTLDLINLLSVNRETYKLLQQNVALIDFMVNTKTLMQFKRNMLNELEKRKRGAVDKMSATIITFDSACFNFGTITAMLSTMLTYVSFFIAAVNYGIDYAEDLKAFPKPLSNLTTTNNTDVGSMTDIHWNQPEPSAELLAKTKNDLAASIGCGAAGLFVFTLSIALIIILHKKEEKLFHSFNSTNNAKIKVIEDQIRETILNTTKEESKSSKYQEWMMQFIWNEKVNQPVTPFVPDDVEAQPALGMSCIHKA